MIEIKKNVVVDRKDKRDNLNMYHKYNYKRF